MVSKAFNALRSTVFHFVDEWATLAGKMKANLSKQQRNGIRENLIILTNEISIFI